jgi:hypothetical protein
MPSYEAPHSPAGQLSHSNLGTAALPYVGAYSDIGHSTLEGDLSLVVAQSATLAGGAGSRREAPSLPVAAIEPLFISRPFDAPYDGTGDSAPQQDDLHWALAQFKAPASGAGSEAAHSWRPLPPRQPPPPPPPLCSPPTGHSMAQDAPSQIPVQFTAPTGSATARPPGPSSGQELIASGSRPGKRASWETQINPEHIVNWGSASVSGATGRAQVAREAQGNFSTPIDPARLRDTAAPWFSNPRDGVLPEGGKPAAPAAPLTLTMPPWSPHTGHPMAHQDSIASGSQSGGQQTEETKRFKSELVNWGKSVASGGTFILDVASDVQRKFGTPIRKAKRWFKASSADGLSASGRRRLSLPAPLHQPAIPNQQGLGLNEAQFLQLREAFKAGITVKTALASIERSDLRDNTVGMWFNRRAEDGLTDRGRAIRKIIHEKENKTKGG